MFMTWLIHPHEGGRESCGEINIVSGAPMGGGFYFGGKRNKARVARCVCALVCVVRESFYFEKYEPNEMFWLVNQETVSEE